MSPIGKISFICWHAISFIVSKRIPLHPTTAQPVDMYNSGNNWNNFYGWTTHFLLVVFCDGKPIQEVAHSQNTIMVHTVQIVNFPLINVHNVFCQVSNILFEILLPLYIYIRYLSVSQCRLVHAFAFTHTVKPWPNDWTKFIEPVQ